MGRLFWKFFFFIWLAQLTTIWGVGGAIWMIRHNENQKLIGLDVSRPASFLVDAAAATLQHGGVPALQDLLRVPTRHQVYVLDDVGHEILDRPVPADVQEKVREALQGGTVIPTIRKVDSAGHIYRLFVPDTEHEVSDRLLPRRSPPSLFPLVPVGAATLASLIFAALLAGYLSKPIRHLRSAFKAVAEGKFEVNLHAIMGKRRDDLADLGRDFDYLALQLRNSIEGQRRLMHDISHELRSPLARLQAAIGLMRQQPEKVESSLVRIERESVRMDKLVGEILTLSRLEAGVTGTMDQSVNFFELLEDVANDAQFEARAQDKDVRLSGIGNATVRGNEELLHQALENVVRNAVKHAPAGTRVEIEIWVDPRLQRLGVSILDQGPGVPDTELPLIFEPFYRSSAQEKNVEGHGLGLAISRRILEAHGGSIRARNRSAGGGLRVEIMIPVATVLHLESHLREDDGAS